MRIAIPAAQGLLCEHFGQCRQFVIFDIDPETSEVIREEPIIPPPHDRGVFPDWLRQQGCTHVIAGGMGGRAQALFNQAGMEVICGAPPAPPRAVVDAFLANRLTVSGNPCADPGFKEGGHRGDCHHE